MSIKHATWPWASRTSAGTLHYKNLYNNTFGYTETQKKVAAGTTTAVLAATSVSSSAATTVTSGFTQPDVPRALSITVGGTASSVQACTITVTGTNIEGKTITETFITTIASTGTINGTKAFFSVTQLDVPKQVGSGVTVAIGTRNVLGINHRLFNQNTTVKVYAASTAYGALTLQGAPTVVANESSISQNTVAPATTPDGTKFYVICYTYDNWADGTSVNDSPEYSTTTSTSSTSTSTSTTTITTSTSSTSTSISSSSTSSTSTSISTSSTSTSTTTTP
jgi:hypothetical protein